MAPITRLSERRRKARMAAIDPHISALPQELQDMILDNILWENFTHKVTIDGLYKPPLGLQIDSRSRSRFAQQYYRDTTFDVRPERFGRLARWLKTLTRHHQQAIKRVQYTSDLDMSQPEVAGRHIGVCLRSLRIIAKIDTATARRFFYLNAVQTPGTKAIWLPADGNIQLWRRMIIMGKLLEKAHEIVPIPRLTITPFQSLPR